MLDKRSRLAAVLGAFGISTVGMPSASPAPRVTKRRIDTQEKLNRIKVSAERRHKKHQKRYEVWVAGIVEQPGDLAFKHNMPDHLHEKLAYRLS